MSKISCYDVIKAIDGKECFKKMNESSTNPDLILLDIMMPDISGWDIAAKIKENPRWNSIPIVFLTAKGDKSIIGIGGNGCRGLYC